MVITVNISNEKELNDYFKKLKSFNISDTWQLVSPEISNAVESVFFNNNWKPLKPKYLKWKVQEGYPNTIGIRTGELKNAVQNPIITKSTSLEWKVSEIGYAGYFNSIRPLLDIKTIGNKVVDAVSKYLDKFLK